MKIIIVEYNLPKHIVYLIEDFILGNKNDWKLKYNRLLTNTFIPYNPRFDYIYKLNPCLYQRRQLKEMDIEDNFYCPICGEKTLFYAFVFNKKSEKECMCI